MSGVDQLSRFAPHIERLVEDDYVQDQIRQAISDLRRSIRRARGKSASKAIADQPLRSQLRQAVRSFVEATRAVKAPPPKRHPIRRALLLAIAIAVVLLAGQQLAKRSGGTNHQGGSNG